MMDTGNAKRLRDILGDARLSTLQTAEALQAAHVGTNVRLLELYGLGDKPRVRRRLYAVIDSIIERHGHKSQLILSKTIQQSQNKVHPDRWFCSVVLNRLAESGYRP